MGNRVRVRVLVYSVILENTQRFKGIMLFMQLIN